ncbi:MAG: hypothetical protein WBC85_04710 [Planktotalea sp.]|uniref:hypothetical protein n=1 Tax=Planktotalea sp. TaxID=2029877 RepID=UPI003C733D33
MRSLSAGVFFSAVLGLAACDNSNAGGNDDVISGTPTAAQLAELEAKTVLVSGFGTPRADGTFSTSLATIFKGSYKDANGNGYALEIGRDETTFSARVGLISGTDGGDLPTSGIASMRGVYQVAEVGKSQGDAREYGEPVVTSGRITLRADFEHGTLQGNDEALSIDGVFSGKSLTGNAYFHARQAMLGGQVGEDRAVGIFHGADDASTFVGGFLVER